MQQKTLQLNKKRDIVLKHEVEQDFIKWDIQAGVSNDYIQVKIICLQKGNLNSMKYYFTLLERLNLDCQC